MHEMGHAIDFWAFGRCECSSCLISSTAGFVGGIKCHDISAHRSRYRLGDHPLAVSPNAELLRRADRDEDDPEKRADCFGNIILSSVTGNGTAVSIPCSPHHAFESASSMTWV